MSSHLMSSRLMSSPLLSTHLNSSQLISSRLMIISSQLILSHLFFFLFFFLSVSFSYLITTVYTKTSSSNLFHSSVISTPWCNDIGSMEFEKYWSKRCTVQLFHYTGTHTHMYNTYTHACTHTHTHAHTYTHSLTYMYVPYTAYFKGNTCARSAGLMKVPFLIFYAFAYISMHTHSRQILSYHIFITCTYCM